MPGPHSPLDAAPPAPEGPLTKPYVVGLAPVLGAVCRAAGGVLDGVRAKSVIGRLGDRYTITVDTEGVAVKRLLRTRRVAWADAETVGLERTTTIAARRVAAKGAGRLVRLPGLSWLVTQVLSGLGGWLADAAADRLDHDVPQAVVSVTSRRGGGIDLDGPLALISVLASGLTDVIVREARARQVVVLDAAT